MSATDPLVDDGTGTETSLDTGSLADRGRRGQDSAEDGSSGTQGNQPQGAELKGTGFNSVQELVAGYRTLSDRVKATDGRLSRMDSGLTSLITTLAKQAQGKDGGAKQASPEEFLKKFLQNPEGTFNAAVRELVTAESKRLETKYDTRLSQNEQSVALEKFYETQGKRLSKPQQDRFLEILDANEPLWAHPNVMGLVMGLLIAEDPTIHQSLKGGSGGDTSMRDAKGAASDFGSKRTSVGAQGTGKQNKDEFDDVLDLYEAETGGPREANRGRFQPKNPRKDT